MLMMVRRSCLVLLSGLLANFDPIHAQMLQPLPGQKVEPIPPGVLLTAADYIKSVSSRWSPQQALAWQSLDAGFRAWVTQLMWRAEQDREIANELHVPVSHGYDPYFLLVPLPSGCSVTPYSDPPRWPSVRTYILNSVEGGMKPAERLAWDNLEPAFRSEAEIVMYEDHYLLLRLQTKAGWWRANITTIEACFRSRLQPLTPPQAAALRFEKKTYDDWVDVEAEAQKQEIRDRFAPFPAKPERIERIEAEKEIEKYEHDMDRSQRAEPRPSPSPNEHWHSRN